MSDGRVFLVFSGGNDRAVLAFLRALSLCGQRALIVARTGTDRILRTRYRRDVVHVRETADLTLAIVQDCIGRARSKGSGEKLVILPSSEYFNHFLLQHRDRIEQLDCEIPLVNTAVYDLLTNKRSAAALFASAGVQIPAEVPTLDRMRLPLVAKPLRNVVPGGGTQYPVLLRTAADADRFMSTFTVEDFFFQELVEGESLYLLVHMARDHERVLLWSQRNLLQQPQGKSMLLAEPCGLHEQPIAARLVDVLRAARFSGLGMIEMIRDGDRLVFIEMNPRIWGPIQFCLDQGRPLLQAFIGECLHGDPERYADRHPRRRSYYCWFGGLLDTLYSHARPDWHANRLSWLNLTRICAGSDVYLRADSWRCFFSEIGQSMFKVMNGNRSQG